MPISCRFQEAGFESSSDFRVDTSCFYAREIRQIGGLNIGTISFLRISQATAPKAKRISLDAPTSDWYISYKEISYPDKCSSVN